MLGARASAAVRLAAPKRSLFVALVMFLLGCMLYLTIITLIFYRFTFLPLDRGS